MRSPTPLTRRDLLTGALGSLAGAVPLLLRSPWAQAQGTPPDWREAEPITGADQVLSVMDFEALARGRLPPAHFGFIATGVDDDATVVRNHAAFADYQIRARRFFDVRQVDLTTRVYGVEWATPVYISALSAQRAFHREGELATARAAASRKAHLMLSNAASRPIEPVLAARGAPAWQQLYPTDDWEVGKGIVRRAEAAGASAIVLTVDSAGPRNSESLKRAIRHDARDCGECHDPAKAASWKNKPMYEGLDVSRVTQIAPLNVDAAYLDRLRSSVKVKLLIKGIVTGEDAAFAVEHGADGVIVSNHGGRNEETLRAGIDCLAEVVAAVHGRVPVFMDGGVRRGTDVFKALALGAAGVGIGRPQAWGLASFGQEGVEAVLDIFNRELADIMRHAGAANIAAIGSRHVLHARSG
jgi:isopentenyl diphosphate isomerase/L-lactate dehydrogenase-like FMN-dependent dehydrogenase